MLLGIIASISGYQHRTARAVPFDSDQDDPRRTADDIRDTSDLHLLPCARRSRASTVRFRGDLLGDITCCELASNNLLDSAPS